MSWIGSQANIFEKQKVREIATLIRDTERHGKAQITNINEGEETQEMLQVSVLWNKNLLFNFLYYLYTVAFFSKLLLFEAKQIHRHHDELCCHFTVKPTGSWCKARAEREHSRRRQPSRCIKFRLPLQGA